MSKFYAGGLAWVYDEHQVNVPVCRAINENGTSYSVARIWNDVVEYYASCSYAAMEITHETELSLGAHIDTSRRFDHPSLVSVILKTGMNQLVFTTRFEIMELLRKKIDEKIALHKK